MLKADIVSLKTKVINIAKQIGDPNTPGEISQQFGQLFTVNLTVKLIWMLIILLNGPRVISGMIV